MLDFVGFLVFSGLFGTGYVVAHAWCIRLARSLEAGGRLRGRGTVVLLTGPLILIVLGVAFVVVSFTKDWAGLEPVDPDATDVGDLIAVGAATPVIAALGGWAAVRLAVALPPRRRGRPPVRMLETLAPVLRWSSRALIPLMVAGLVVAFISGWANNRPRGADWLWFAIAVPLMFWLCWSYGTRGRRLLSQLAAQWSGPPEKDPSVTLYLRPFDEERTVFAPGRTLEEFLGPEIRARLGEFVALGSPHDRLPPPGGALRIYRSDASWQEAVDELIHTSRCIVGAMRSSTNTG